VTDDEKLPLEEDDGPEEQSKPQTDPFSDYINENLSLADVPSDGEGKLPADDVGPFTKPKPSPPTSSGSNSPFDSDKEDDFDEDSSPFNPRPPGLVRPPGSSFGPSRFGLPRPLGPSDGKDESLKPSSPSPFGSRFSPPPSSGSPGGPSGSGPAGWPPFGGSRFGSGSGSSTPPPSSFGSRSGTSSTPPNRPESRFGPYDKPLDSLRRSSWRALQEDLGELLDKEARAIIAVLVALVIVLLNLLYIDNLRLTIATQEGQITELRQQVEQAQKRLEELKRD